MSSHEDGRSSEVRAPSRRGERAEPAPFAFNQLRGPARSAIRFPVDPRDIPDDKVARRLHLTLPQLLQVKEELYARGFPRPDPTTGMTDLIAIDRWMDTRSGLSVGADPSHASPSARDARDAFVERVRQLGGR